MSKEMQAISRRKGREKEGRKGGREGGREEEHTQRT